MAKTVLFESNRLEKEFRPVVMAWRDEEYLGLLMLRPWDDQEQKRRVMLEVASWIAFTGANRLSMHMDTYLKRMDKLDDLTGRRGLEGDPAAVDALAVSDFEAPDSVTITMYPYHLNDVGGFVWDKEIVLRNDPAGQIESWINEMFLAAMKKSLSEDFAKVIEPMLLALGYLIMTADGTAIVADPDSIEEIQNILIPEMLRLLGESE
jgi:hypothetical protein